MERTEETDHGDDLERREDNDHGHGPLETPAPVAEQNRLFCHPPQQHTIDPMAAERKGQHSKEEDTAWELSLLS